LSIYFRNHSEIQHLGKCPGRHGPQSHKGEHHERFQHHPHRERTQDRIRRTRAERPDREGRSCSSVRDGRFRRTLRRRDYPAERPGQPSCRLRHRSRDCTPLQRRRGVRPEAQRLRGCGYPRPSSRARLGHRGLAGKSLSILLKNRYSLRRTVVTASHFLGMCFPTDESKRTKKYGNKSAYKDLPHWQLFVSTFLYSVLGCVPKLMTPKGRNRNLEN